MPEVTPRLDLIKPEYDESSDIAVINSNMDVLDGAVGVSIVNSVIEIDTPFNGQMAYELTPRQLRFFINGEWLLVAAGDLNSGNPDRIRLPAGNLDDLADTTNAFQVGSDGANNLAMDQNTIQARNNGAAAPMYLNENGGQVIIGKDGPVTITKEGITSPAQTAKDASDGTNISVGAAAGSWASGSPNVKTTVTAPPGGKIACTVVSAVTVNGTNFKGNISFRVTRVSNSSIVANEGGATRTAYVRHKGAGNTAAQRDVTVSATISVTDIIPGLIAGEEYEVQAYHMRSAAEEMTIDWRRIVAIPTL